MVYVRVHAQRRVWYRQYAISAMVESVQRSGVYGIQLQMSGEHACCRYYKGGILFLSTKNWSTNLEGHDIDHRQSG